MAHHGGNGSQHTGGMWPSLCWPSLAEPGPSPSWLLPCHLGSLPGSVATCQVALQERNAGKRTKAFVTPKIPICCGITAILLMPVCSKSPCPSCPNTAVPVTRTELSTPMSRDAHQNLPEFGTDESLSLAQALTSGQGATGTDEKQRRDLADFIPGAMALGSAAPHLRALHTNMLG